MWSNLRHLLDKGRRYAPVVSWTLSRRGWAVAATVLAALPLGVSGCGDGGSPPSGGVSLKRGGELAAWAPDGRSIATPGTAEINLLSNDGSVIRRLAVPGVRSATWPCECKLGWSQGGHRILFVARRGSDGRGARVGSVGIEGGSLRSEPLGVPAGDTAWSPQGWPLVFVVNSGAYEFNTPHRGPRPNLWRLDGLHAKPYPILSQPGTEIRPQFSPDGTKVIYVRKQKGRRSVWVVDADGSNPHLVADGFLTVTVAWGPDSSRVAVAGVRREGSESRLYLGSVTGRGLKTLSGTAGATTALAWAPNQHWITYGGTGGTIWRLHPDGSGREQVGDLPGREIRRLLWSPDGKHLAYAAMKRQEDFD
jgi:dipeptidyl aminopeptidase/acylaminoacyl peptidase